MRWLMMFAMVVVGACGASDEDAEARVRRAKAEAQIEEPKPEPDLLLWDLRLRVAKAESEAKAKGATDHAAELAVLSKERINLARDLAELDKQVAAAVDAVVAAQYDADRAASAAHLKKLKKQMLERIEAAELKVARVERRKRAAMPQGCVDAPLGRGGR